MVAREMGSGQDPNDGLLTAASQVVSLYLAKKATVRLSDPDEMHSQTCEEGSNFSQAKEAVEIIQFQHPLVFDKHDLCALAMEGTPKRLKLSMQQ